ncbi:MAG: hypothetical protein Q6363_003125 [Candidatus Njordarchaeota archaeon]
MEKKLTVDILREKVGFIAPEESLARISREYWEVRKCIKNILSKKPANVVELAREIGIPQEKIVWYVATFLRLGIIRIVDKDDEGRFVFCWSEE